MPFQDSRQAISHSSILYNVAVKTEKQKTLLITAVQMYINLGSCAAKNKEAK